MLFKHMLISDDINLLFINRVVVLVFVIVVNYRCVDDISF